MKGMTGKRRVLTVFLTGLVVGARMAGVGGATTQQAPPVYKPFMIQYQNEEDVVEIVEIMRPLRLNGVIPNSGVIAHALYEAPLKAKRSDYVPGPVRSRMKQSASSHATITWVSGTSRPRSMAHRSRWT